MFEHNPETSSIQWRIIGAMVVAFVLLLAATSAYAAGQNKEPWSGQKYDRAGMAVIMHNVDSGSSASSNRLPARHPPGCGGGCGSSRAQRHSSCNLV